jgi:hypothetical protein
MITAAVTASGFTVPVGLGKTESDVLTVLFNKESGMTHSIAPVSTSPWHRICVNRGDSTTVRPNTRGDASWGQVKGMTWRSYAQWTVFDPQGGMNISAAYLKDCIPLVGVAGPKAKMWHALHKYKSGNWNAPGGVLVNPKTAQGSGAEYANGRFQDLGITPPQSNNE